MKTQITELQKMVRESTLADLYGNMTIHTDYYKYTHPHQYPEDLERLCLYSEPRIGGAYPKICFTGLQVILKEYFMSVPAFKQLLLTQAWVKSASGGYDYFAMEAWKRVEKLGYVPITIHALPEGTVVPQGTPLFYYTSTDPFFTKNMSILEDLLMHTWSPVTIGSRMLNMKENLRPYFQKTGCEEKLEYSVFDFSLRSATCPQDAVRKGAAFLFHFFGSDNTPADIIGIMKHYNGPQVLKSVWATEHSVALSFGPGEGEKAYLKHQLLQAPKNAILSNVIDTYSSRNFMENVVGDEEIKTLIRERSEQGGRIVWRPDSGIAQDEIAMCFHFCEKHFGSSMQNGYKILGANNGTLMGDGIDEYSGVENYKTIVENGWSAANLVEASGRGFFSLNVDRDTLRFAIKPSIGVRAGVEIPMQKNPLGSPFKKSKAGNLKVYEENGRFKTVTSTQIGKTEFDTIKSQLVPVFENGTLLADYTYDEVVTQIQRTKNFAV